MTADQLEQVIVFCLFAYATLLGFGVIRPKAETARIRQAKKLLQVIGPLGMLWAVFMFALTLAR